MYRKQWIRFLAVPAVALAVACGDTDDQARAPAADAPAIDPATAGAVVGTISFEGQAPAPTRIDMSEEPRCAERHAEPPTRQSVIAGPDGGLKNVFVRVTEGLPERAWPAPSEDVELDQVGCVYTPHVLGIRTNQTLVIRNSDGLLHNVNVRPQNQRGFNISQPTNMTTNRTFARPEVMIPVRCDVHGWMESYLGVVEHPYFAVSAEDGAYRIENLPAGDYVLETWHERYGTQTQNVTVVAQEEARADFRYSAAMAGAHVPLGAPIDLHDHGPAGHAGGGH